MASDRIDSTDGMSNPAHLAVNLARHGPIQLPPLIIIPATRQLRHDDGRELTLEPRTMQVLVALAEANGTVLSRDELVERCWEARFIGDEAISSVVYRLRKSLRDLAGDAIKIETIPKVGFRLVAQASPSVRGLHGWMPRARLSRVLVLIAGIMAILILVLLLRVNTGRQPLALSEKARPSIVVLPFKTISPDGQYEFFAEGMTEEIMSRLSENPDLTVIGQTSTALLDKENSVEDARRRLGITHLLEGSVRRNGEALRVDVRLVDARTNSQLWSQQFDRTLGDVLAIQADIGAQVLSRMNLSFPTAGRPVRHFSSSPQVYDLYLTAIGTFRAATTFAEARPARDLLKKAVRLDPDYAPAWAKLAIIEAYDSDKKTWEVAKQHARRALALAPNLAEAQSAMGIALISDRDWAASEPYFKEALAIDPGNYTALTALADIQFQHQCRPADAVANLQRAAKVEPLAGGHQAALVRDRVELGQFDAAEAAVRGYALVRPDDGLVPQMRSIIALSSGDISRAILEARKAQRLNSGRAKLVLMQGLRAIGRRKEAAQVIAGSDWVGVVPELAGDHRQAVKQVMKWGDDIWLLSWDWLAPGSAILLRNGKSKWLVKSFDRTYRSVEEFDQVMGCKQLPGLAPNVILALRNEGRTRDADRLLQLAMKRYAEARRAGYRTGWKATEAELLLVAGQPNAALASLDQVVREGFADQSWPWGSLEYPVYDSVRNDPRFKAIEVRIARHISKERAELAAEEAKQQS